MTDISKEAVTRYDPSIYCEQGTWNDAPIMESSLDGEYVEYADYQALQAEIERLKERLTIYEGKKSTPEAPVGMTGLVDDMAGTISTTQAIVAQVWQEAIEAAVSSMALPENGNAGPPQDATDRLLDAQRRSDAEYIRAIPNPYEVKK